MLIGRSREFFSGWSENWNLTTEFSAVHGRQEFSVVPGASEFFQ